MSEWWLSRGDGKTEGPLTTQTLVQGLVTGQIPKISHICRVGEQRWLRVSQVDEVWEAANPEQVKTNVTERPWFLSGTDLSQAPSSPDIETDRARVLTPQPTIDATAAKQTFSTPLPQTSTHRELFARQALQSPKPAAVPNHQSDSAPTQGSMRPKVPTLTGISDASGANLGPSRPRPEPQATPVPSGAQHSQHQENRAPGTPTASPAGLPGLQALGGAPGAVRFGSTMPGLPTLGALLGPSVATAPAQPGPKPLQGLGTLPNAPPDDLHDHSDGRSPPRQNAAGTHANAPLLRDERLRSGSGASQTPGYVGPPPRPLVPPKLVQQPETPRVPAPGRYGAPPPVAHSASRDVKSADLLPTDNHRGSGTKPQMPSIRPIPVPQSAEDEERTTIVHSPFVKPSHAAPSHSREHSDTENKTTIAHSPIITPADPQTEDDDEQTSIAKSPYVLRSPLPVSEDDEQTTIASSPNIIPARSRRMSDTDEDKTTIAKSPLAVSLKSQPPTADPTEWDTAATMDAATRAAPTAQVRDPMGVLEVKPTRDVEVGRNERARAPVDTSTSSQDDDETHLIPPKVQPSLRPPLPHRSSGNVGVLSRPLHDVTTPGGNSLRASELTNAARSQKTDRVAPTNARARAGSFTNESAQVDAPQSDMLLSDPSQLMEECYDDSAGAKIHPAPVLPLGRNKPQEVSSSAAQAVLAPAAAPPAARRPRLPSAPSIVFKHEPLNHQEATQPAARVLRELQARKPGSGGFLLFLLVVMVAAAAAYYYLLGRPDWL